jgi:quinol-cytochrome oxidoreductase complex cytochrome b subunit
MTSPKTSSSRNSRKSFTDLLAHLHPPTVPIETMRFRLSYGLGGMTAVLIFLLVVTGMLQLLTYDPTVTGAYSSVMEMYRQEEFAGWIHNIHHWSANALIIVVSLHFLRVFFTGAFGPGRRLNWLIGLILMFLVLSANFSGYLLPWDQLGYWAVTICTSMMGYVPFIGSWLMELFRGGAEVGPSTLANFYGLHIAFIPASFAILMAYHFWLVRKSGGLVKKIKTSQTPVPRLSSTPHLIVREAAVGLSLIALVLIISIFVHAPIHGQANPGMSPNPAKAPWYFLGFQELLLHLHPVFAICVVPVLALAALLFLPFWKEAVLPAGIWFGGKRGSTLAIWSFASGALTTFLIIILDDLLFRTGLKDTGLSDIASRGWIPLFTFIALLIGGYQVLVRKLRFSRAEAVMAGMTLCCAALIALTIVGIWLRGPGMQLILFGQ